MPIYEYLCPPCNRVFSFMAKSHAESVSKQPACPKCGRQSLRKRMSTFAVAGSTRKSKDDTGRTAGDEAAPNSESNAGGSPGEDRLDDPRVEAEMERLMSDAEGLDEKACGSGAVPVGRGFGDVPVLRAVGGHVL